MSKVVVLLHFADPSFQAATPTKKTPPKPRVGNEEKLKPTSELLYTLVCIYTVVSHTYLLLTFQNVYHSDEKLLKSLILPKQSEVS